MNSRFEEHVRRIHDVQHWRTRIITDVLMVIVSVALAALLLGLMFQSLGL